MKKIIALGAMAVLAVSSVFADITLSGTGRTVLVPFGIRLENSDNNAPAETYFGAENPWNGDGPRLGVNLKGQREEGNMGFNFTLTLEKGTFVVDDNIANVWIKPFSLPLTFTFGIFSEDTLRFKYAGSGSSFHNYVMYIRGDLLDEEGGFRRFQSGGFGTHIAIEPIENLYIGAAIGSIGDSRSFAGEFKEDGWLNAMKATQVGVAYTVPGIVFARLQWIGFRTKEWEETAEAVAAVDGYSMAPGGTLVKESTLTLGNTWFIEPVAAKSAKYEWVDKTGDKPLNGIGDAGKLQAAFNIKAIDKVDIEVGFTVPFVDEKDEWTDADKTTKLRTVKTQEDFLASFGVDVNTRPFRLWSHGSFRFAGYKETSDDADPTKNVKIENGTDFAWFLTPMFYFDNGLILVADLFMDVRFGSDVPAVVKDLKVAGGDADATLCITDTNAKNNYFDLGFGLYLRKNFAGGDIRGGVTVKLPGGEGHAGAKPQIFIPVMFNYGF